MQQKIAIIFGAGPAGLTAAFELLNRTDIKPIIFEKTEAIGGISQTVNYKGNRIDIGGHRFFSKSQKVMAWWHNILPLAGAPARDDLLLNRTPPLSNKKNAPDPELENKVMLVRSRLSRILFLRSFFDYPISLKWNTVKNLGFLRMIKIGLSYVKAKCLPISRESSLEDFFINRFGKELYRLFFKDYTQKVWGVPCSEIGQEWGAQRIKGLSIMRAVLHAVKTMVRKDTSVEQKDTETSLIEQFTYPKFGPGQLWEEVGRQIKEQGGEIHYNKRVVGIIHRDNSVTGIRVKDEVTKEHTTHDCDYAFSTMPVKELIPAFTPQAPAPVNQVAQGLVYRDFITVGVLLKKMQIKNQTSIPSVNNIAPDNWIYIQERDVKLGRIQIFNNWSPYMVKDETTVWIGLEYFCNEGDRLWRKTDEQMRQFAIEELEKINFARKEDVLDTTVIKMPKTYPAYFGSFNDFHLVREYTDLFENLFLIGRNGMHRYNNADHSMLCAMTAVDNILSGIGTKDNIWRINTEEEYHETR